MDVVAGGKCYKPRVKCFSGNSSHKDTLSLRSARAILGLKASVSCCWRSQMKEQVFGVWVSYLALH